VSTVAALNVVRIIVMYFLVDSPLQRSTESVSLRFRF
jgi:hypothetical protein